MDENGWDDKRSELFLRPLFVKKRDFREVPLTAVDMTVMSTEQCQEDYFRLNHNSRANRIVPKFEFCAVPGKKDSCSGDSGGPFICEERGKAVLQVCIDFTYKCAR